MGMYWDIIKSFFLIFKDVKKTDPLHMSDESISADFTIDENEIIHCVNQRDTGKVDNFVGFYDVKKFYGEFIDLLTYNRYGRFVHRYANSDKDEEVGKFIGSYADLGEHIVTSEMHGGNGFEVRFRFDEMVEEGTFEVEWEVKARTESGKGKFSPYGWIEFNMEMVNRFSPRKEVVEGNEKKVLYGGKWEFRCQYLYKNNLIPKYLNTLPIIKNNHKLKHLYIEHIAKKSILKDIWIFENRIVPMLQDFINDFFKKI
jgi:hypothetical protein